MVSHGRLSMARVWLGLQATLVFQLSTFHDQSLFAQAKIACRTNVQCENTLRGGSECINGFCSNPFLKGGCLQQMKPGWKRTRVCTSEDPPDAAENGFCHPPDSRFGYTELRISPQNWLSVYVETWMLQILLSEMLGVPVTVETSLEDKNADFYNPESKIEYGVPNDYVAIETSRLFDGDCTKIEQEPGDYIPCSHFIPENWLGQNPESGMEDLFGYDPSTESLDPPIQLGAISQESWFIPKFTAERDPSLLSFLGIQGEANRQKLAERFHRPTSWKDYCELVSNNTCATADSVATRAPEEEEYDTYFVKGLFTGYFRKTDENDCEKNPTTCTGHITDYPCGWSSNVRPVAYWNNIALESNGPMPGSNGYGYSQIVQIMQAANATKSDFLVLWWYPDLDYQRYLGTDAELIKVTLPTVTQSCLDNLVSAEDRCSLDEEIRNGDSRGKCDDPPLALQKVIGSIVRDMSKNPSVPEELHSPVYDILRDFSLSSYEIGQLFDYYFQLNVDPDNYDIREATCKWFVENFEAMESLIPEGYPRTLQNDKIATDQPIYYAAIFFAALSTFVVLVACFVTYVQRNHKVMRLAQVEFLAVILLGLMMVSIGSIMAAIPPTDGSCVAAVWMVNVGYTLELVPLVVRMAAIFRLMRAAQQMQHAEFTRKSLFTAVAMPTLVISIFLIIWNVSDPPKQEFEYRSTNKESDDGDFIIAYRPYCSSDWNYWWWLAVGWHFLLLLTATVQAFQARAVMRKFADESQSLTIMIYSHFVFVWFRLVSFLLEGSFNDSDLALARSLVYSVDTIFTIFIYFVPKFLTSDEEKQEEEDNGGDQESETPSEKEFKHLTQMALVNRNGNDALGDIGHPGYGDDTPPAIVDVIPGNVIQTAVYDGDEHAGYGDDHPGYEDPQESSRRRPSGGDEHPGGYVVQVQQPSDADAHPGYSDDDDDGHPGYGDDDDDDEHPGYG